MDIQRSITSPMEAENWLKTILIGGVLTFLGVLIVPLLIVYGYLVRVIRGTLSEATEPPTFDDWGDLLVDGVKAWIISLVYMLVPLLVAGFTVGGSILAFATGTEAGAAAGAGGLWLGFSLSALLALVFGYLTVIAIVNFAREGVFGAGFDFDVIRTVAVDREYALAWLVSVVIFVVAGIVSAIPLVGWILTPFVSFYAAVVAADLWAGGFAQALESTGAITRPRDEDVAV
ncbi:Uncharacterized membrane protein, DUF4013 family [Halanaeroarchaeum sp. HSR-CO]|uniref:DUF4013 domain-containing protein n=1 Tax=Halanaeroarchaeum sp. HSR-CO TaxID=2866382 RepID=UPI00217F052D|nr:DUF4013 domain-containing protein [Halanaeroarchaeum sp. HSR-CO]UWG46683.1 Uncharacterized membrane protein, DUF4013 family [Halanaeroarchaeum sp. HSR-CO]